VRAASARDPLSNHVKVARVDPGIPHLLSTVRVEAIHDQRVPEEDASMSAVHVVRESPEVASIELAGEPYPAVQEFDGLQRLGRQWRLESRLRLGVLDGGDARRDGQCHLVSTPEASA
jgi:hypothetical protein